MSDDSLRSFISRYNFSRRTIDHRMHYDFNYARNKPILTTSWYGAAKNRFINSMVYSFGPYTASAVVFIGGFLVALDSLWRLDSSHESILTKPNFTPTENFLNHRNDYSSNKGKWNHNFSCWENDKNCGRDYDWIKVNPKSEQ